MVALTRSANADNSNHSFCAASDSAVMAVNAASNSSCVSVDSSNTCVTDVTCSASILAFDVAELSDSDKRTNSSAASFRRASRSSACTVCARRAASAWRASGFNWRPSSVVRSVRRSRFACMPTSLRCAFSLRRRCLSTPAASSIKARRSSGRDSRICDSRPCPTITCISRPIPESLSNS